MGDVFMYLVTRWCNQLRVVFLVQLPGLVFAGGFADDLDGAGCLFAGHGKPHPEGGEVSLWLLFDLKHVETRWNMKILKTLDSWSFGLEDFSFECDF